MGIGPGSIAYRNHYLFQKRKLPKPYNQPPPPEDVTNSKP
jgi:hypothetical protein